MIFIIGPRRRKLASAAVFMVGTRDGSLRVTDAHPGACPSESQLVRPVAERARVAGRVGAVR